MLKRTHDIWKPRISSGGPKEQRKLLILQREASEYYLYPPLLTPTSRNVDQESFVSLALRLDIDSEIGSRHVEAERRCQLGAVAFREDVCWSILLRLLLLSPALKRLGCQQRLGLVGKGELCVFGCRRSRFLL